LDKFKKNIKLAKEYNEIVQSGLFDIKWYTEQYTDIDPIHDDPIRHYLEFGVKEGHNPNPIFDTDWYLKDNPDVANKNWNPLIHFIKHGAAEKRAPCLLIKKNDKLIKDYIEIVNWYTLHHKVIDIFINGFELTRSVSLSRFFENSLLSPVVLAPFNEYDKSCFATMENLATYLTGLSDNLEDKDLVSVIMPVYNRIDIVKFAIDSVLEQTYEKFELIIIDDGSTDGSKELLDSISDERVIILHNESCKGASIARNRGLEVAQGKYIAYLDSDNAWDSKYLAAMVGAFLELPDADVLYSGQLLFKDKKNPFAVRFASFNRSLLNNRNYIDLNSFCHTKNVYKKVGGFDDSLNQLEDYDLILRLAETSQMYSVPVLLSHYYFHNAGNRVSEKSGLMENLEAVRNKSIKRTEKMLELRGNSSEINKLNHRVSIIIPNYEALDDIRECINSILSNNMSKCIEIIVVDNNSNQTVVDYLDQLEAQEKIKLIKNDINYGFTYAVNQGISIAENGNDILIMNNDAILTPGSINSLSNAAYELPNCGIVVPQQVLPGKTKTINIHVPYADSNYECDVNLSAHHLNVINLPIFHSGRTVELSFAPFFCVYIKRQVIDNSVGLDVELGRHYRSDQIFCNYVRHMMNLKIYYVSEAIVYHKLQKSTDLLRSKPKKDFNIMFQKNQWEPELADKLGFKKPLWDF